MPAIILIFAVIGFLWTVLYIFYRLTRKNEIKPQSLGGFTLLYEGKTYYFQTEEQQKYFMMGLKAELNRNNNLK